MMTHLEHHDLPADEQLRRALASFAGIFEDMLRRNDECRAELEQTRVRHNADVARFAALEMNLAADRTAIQQMGSLFAGIAQQAASAATPPAAVSLLPPAAEHAAYNRPQDGAEDQLGHLPIGATAPEAAARPDISDHAPDPTARRTSMLSGADLAASPATDPSSGSD
jgi:hypothetical protein